MTTATTDPTIKIKVLRYDNSEALLETTVYRDYSCRGLHEQVEALLVSRVSLYLKKDSAVGYKEIKFHDVYQYQLGLNGGEQIVVLAEKIDDPVFSFGQRMQNCFDLAVQRAALFGFGYEDFRPLEGGLFENFAAPRADSFGKRLRANLWWFRANYFLLLLIAFLCFFYADVALPKDPGWFRKIMLLFAVGGSLKYAFSWLDDLKYQRWRSKVYRWRYAAILGLLWLFTGIPFSLSAVILKAVFWGGLLCLPHAFFRREQKQTVKKKVASKAKKLFSFFTGKKGSK